MKTAKERAEITDIIKEKTDNIFNDFKELNKRYNVPMGIIMIRSNKKIDLSNIIRNTDKIVETEINDKYYYYIFVMFVDIDKLYTVVKKIEYTYMDLEVYFEELEKTNQEHIKNFVDSLFF